ncbi:MAG: hypothetical protein JWL85_30, partial [Candidatus Saccharibacteria bacterium]|nr:hypothetical protein [Candidatus Saccharibacteria bacterium]
MTEQMFNHPPQEDPLARRPDLRAVPNPHTENTPDFTLDNQGRVTHIEDGDINPVDTGEQGVLFVEGPDEHNRKQTTLHPYDSEAAKQSPARTTPELKSDTNASRLDRALDRINNFLTRKSE